MGKRPSIIDDVMLPKAAAATNATVAEEAPASTATMASKRTPRPDVQHTSVYIPRAAFGRLREIAFTERCKVHDLIMQGLDRVLAEHGHSERATRSTTALQHYSAAD